MLAKRSQAGRAGNDPYLSLDKPLLVNADNTELDGPMVLRYYKAAFYMAKNILFITGAADKIVIF